MRETIFTNSLSCICCVRCFSVFCYVLMNENRCLIFCNNQKTPSHLELSFKRGPMVVDVRFENWEMTLNQGIYLRIFASLFIYFLFSFRTRCVEKFYYLMFSFEAVTYFFSYFCSLLVYVNTFIAWSTYSPKCHISTQFA